MALAPALCRLRGSPSILQSPPPALSRDRSVPSLLPAQEPTANYCHRCLLPAGTSPKDPFFLKAAGLPARARALKPQACAHHVLPLSPWVTWYLSSPLSEPLLQNERDNDVIRPLGDSLRETVLCNFFFSLIERAQKRPSEAQLQGTGFKVVASPPSVLPFLLAQTVPFPDAGSALLGVPLPSLLGAAQQPHSCPAQSKAGPRWGPQSIKDMTQALDSHRQVLIQA